MIGAASAKLTRVMSGDSANKPSDKGKGKEEAVAGASWRSQCIKYASQANW